MCQVLSARALMALICISFAVVSAPAAAQFKNAKHAVEYRQGAFKLMGVHFGSIGAMVNGKKPFDAAQAAIDANVVKTVSALPWAAFGDETESIKSDARAEIWLEKEDFLARSKKMQTATAGLLEAAKPRVRARPATTRIRNNRVPQRVNLFFTRVAPKGLRSAHAMTRNWADRQMISRSRRACSR
jgi:cytochrome c556